MFSNDSDSMQAVQDVSAERLAGTQTAALLRLLDQAEQELARFARGFDELAAVCQQAMNESESARRMLGELEESRQEWTRQREQEANELQQEREALIAAWTQLEAEQRELTVQRQTLRLSRADGTSQPHPPAMPGQHPPEAGRESHLPEQWPAPARAADQEANAADFEQLRREIRNHSRHRK